MYRAFQFLIFSIISSTYALAGNYDRTLFGVWSDFDSDCQNTRAEVLLNQSTEPVTFSNPSECIVFSGKWQSVFTDNYFENPRDLHIDHIVPLAWAWDHGASSWAVSEMIIFGNDQDNLVPVERSLNMEKGAKGPDQWLPPKNKCSYFERFELIRNRYELVLTVDEKLSFNVILDACSAND
jgi:hypothetical protein